MTRKRQLLAVLAVLVTCGVSAQSVTDCPREAEAGVDVMIFADGVPVVGATVFFTASNWDSTLSQLSDDSGKVSIRCVPPGDGYEVTILKPGYAASHVTTSASRDRPGVRIELNRIAGRHVRVMHRGSELPGVIVIVTDSDGTTQTIITDDNGLAEYGHLKASGQATIAISLTGFTPQRALIGPDLKNGPLIFDMPIEPVCTPMVVHSENDKV
jgi:hypothetical protein